VSCREVLTALVLSFAALAARAETVVTACGTDTAGGGINLATALTAGGDIRIACAGGPNQITFTAARVLPAATTIEGGGVALIGPGSGVMFTLNAGRALTLRNLSIKHPPSNPADPNLFTGVVYDANDVNVVELTNVTVTDTRLPFAVRRLVARDSTFAGNGDANNSDFGVVMAGDLALQNVVFRDNLSRPFHPLWRSDPTVTKQTIAARVVGCTFERNKRPALWVAGALVIDNSQFVGNGDAFPFKPGGRGKLYGGAIFLELGSSAAGAVEVVLASATISRSTFKNNHGMLGGAVLAWSAALTLQSTDLDANRAVSGGAVVYLSPDRSNPVVSRARLHLAHVKMRDNEAAKDGGALLVLGDVSGDAVQMSRNKAGESGGALAVVSAVVSPKEALPAGFGDELPVSGTKPTTVDLTRTFVLDNTAVQHAVDGGPGVVRFGNSLFARNVATGAGGAAIDAQNVELANSTVIANKGEGLRIEAGGTSGVRIANVILASNAANCTGTLAGLKIDGANLQYPDAGCGAPIPVADPSLDSSFAPTLFSPARNAGAVAVCASHDLVNGRDLYGKARGGATCAVGAVESDVVRDAIDKVGPDKFPWILLLLLLLLLICLVIGLIVGWIIRRRRKKKT
jgi:hypothetical protein